MSVEPRTEQGMRLRYQMKRVEKIADKCGVGKAAEKDKLEEEKAAAEREALAKMTPFEKKQFKMANTMAGIRSNISELDEMKQSGENTRRKAELSQKIRKDIRDLKKEAVVAKTAAHMEGEGKKGDYERLVGHVKKTDDLYTSRFSSQIDDDTKRLLGRGAGQDSNGGGIRPINNLDEEMSNLGQPMVNLREDEEFQQFFMQTRQNDQKMEEALDRISAGVQVLDQQARNINAELKVQAKQLEQIENKTENITADLKSVNKRLKDTIKKVEGDKMCIYLACFLLLLGIAGAIYWAVKGRGD